MTKRIWCVVRRWPDYPTKVDIYRREPSSTSNNGRVVATENGMTMLSLRSMCLEGFCKATGADQDSLEPGDMFSIDVTVNPTIWRAD